MSEDDRWTDVIDQVLDALDDANVSDPDTRDALAEGVKTALESLETGIGLDVQIIGEGFPEVDSPPPTVEVVAGGRTDGERGRGAAAQQGQTRRGARGRGGQQEARR